MQAITLRKRLGCSIFGLCALAWGCSSDAGTQSNAASGGGASLAGATAGGSVDGEAANGGGGGGAATASGGSANGGAASGEFPCEVQQLLATKCWLCHKVDPPGKLLTAADFRRPSTTNPQQSVGDVLLARLQATTSERMPPAPLEGASPAELAAITTWIEAGAPATTCGEDVPVTPDPYDTPVVCTSMKNWTGGNRESPLMRPGGACISCHQKEGEGPVFAVSGTLYPSAHEPNDCNGVDGAAGAQVLITEANGTEHTLEVNAAGNFFLQARSFAYPYQAKVLYQGRERVMVEAQQSGDCNDCHTEAGREKAPGRIFLP